MFESVTSLLTAGLKLWDDKEKTKYQDKLISLKTAYYNEYNKDLSIRSEAALDALALELKILAESFTSAVGK